MRKALIRKTFAFAILMAFVLAMGAGASDVCKKKEAKIYADPAAASADNTAADANAPTAKAGAAADRIGTTAKAETGSMKKMRK